MVLRHASSNAWVACGKERFILGNGSGGHIAVVPDAEGSETKYTILYCDVAQEWARSEGLENSPYGDPEIVSVVGDLEAAIQIGDLSAKKKFHPTSYKQCSRAASWRKKGASESSLKFLLALRGEDDLNTLVDEQGESRKIEVHDSEVRLDQLSSGQVSDWITEFKFGPEVCSSPQITSQGFVTPKFGLTAIE
ncbi:hypothetical protein IAU59_001533 [Kwoniella sp. CBS 9459]